MIKKTAAFIIFVIYSIASYPENMKITWLESSFEPFTITSGEYKGKGMVDQITGILQSELPQYTHERKIANPARIIHEISTGGNVCSVAFIKTEDRMKIMYFSKHPTVFGMPHCVTVLKSKISRFNNGNTVSLEKLMMNNKLKLGIVKGRSYGRRIDRLLKNNKKNNNIYIRHGSDLYEGLFKMLKYGRVDYVLGYPAEAFFLAKKLGIDSEIVNIGIQESDQYSYGYFVVPKNNWGEQLIKEIDLILGSKRKENNYIEAMEYWLDPNSKSTFRRAYYNDFLKK
ncbi:MAG TPA: TIGR02285 family protein [Spirochaetota bacterium]|nr:TIGR02285 family protein [Spirochaetota bacterium]